MKPKTDIVPPKAPARVLALAAALAILGGCATMPADEHVAPADAELARELKKSMDCMYPPRFNAVHRALLTIRGRQLAMIGYVSAERSGRLRLAAAGDLGGTIFEAERGADGGRRVLRRVPSFPQEWVTDGALRDAALICGERPSAAAAAVAHADGSIGLVDDLGNGVTREFVFAGIPPRLTRCILTRRGAVVTEARFERLAAFDGWPRQIPTRILITDRGLGYSVDVTVLELKALDTDNTPETPE